MQKTLLAIAVASVFSSPALVLADDAAAPASPWTVTTNVYGVSDYYFRGITQTWHRPAIQGGVDVAHSSGWYAGLWGSNVSSNQYPGGSSLEFDYYGGYNGKFNDDWGWTAGGHGYYYPGANFDKAAAGGPDKTFNSFEVNLGLSWKFMSVKYSYFVTDWFGAEKKTGYKDDSKGTGYLEFNLAYEFMPTYTVNFHAAHTNVKTETTGGLDPSYSDYLVGVSKTFEGGWIGSLSYVKSTYKDDDFYKPTYSWTNSSTLSDPGSGRVILAIGRVF